jgi:hypothetical protein
VRRFEQEVQAAFPPPVVVRAPLAPLAWLAGRRRERRLLRRPSGDRVSALSEREPRSR